MDDRRTLYALRLAREALELLDSAPLRAASMLEPFHDTLKGLHPWQ